jgi:hypothetical protein
VASLGDLVVNLRANKSDFDKGMQQATQHMAAFAAAAGAAVAGAVYKFAAFGDELQKNSLRTGVAVEALSALNYAAGQSGASVEAVAKSFAGLARFTNDLRRGSATAVDAMQMMGLELDDLAGLSPEQSYRVLADAIAGIEDPLLQGAAAQQIFGRSGRELLPMLKGGSAEIDRLTAKAEHLGTVFDQRTADSAAAVTDAMDDMSTALTAATVRFGAMFAPAVTAALTAMAGFVGENQNLIRVIGVTAAGVGVFSAAMLLLSARTKAYAAAAAFAKMVTSPAGFLQVAAAVGVTVGAVAAINLALDDTSDVSTRTSAAIGNLTDDADDLAGAMDTAAAAAKQVPDWLGVTLRQLEDIRPPAKAASDQMLEFESNLKRLQKYTGMAANIGADVERFRQHASGYTDALAEVQAELDILQGNATETSQKLARMAEFGVYESTLAILEQEIAKRDRILRQQEEQNALMRDAQTDAAAIIQSLKTDEQLRADQVARIQELHDLGLLTAQQMEEAIAKLSPTEDTGQQQKRQQTAGAMQRGSAEAFSAIVQAMGQKDPQVAHIDQMRKAVVAELQKLNKKKPVEIEEAGAV